MPEKVMCGDCRGISYVGGADIYSCIYDSEYWAKLSPEQRQRVIEQRMEIECDKFNPARRELRVKMKELTEMGITEVHGNGRAQIPKAIREALELADGDKILWIRRGPRDFTFRKVGYRPPFKPHYL